MQVCETVHPTTLECLKWVELDQINNGFDLLDISVADANLLLSQVLVCLCTVWVYNTINRAFKGN